MLRIILLLSFILSASASELGGFIYMNADKSETFLIIDEIAYNGQLKDLYKKMALEVREDPKVGTYKGLELKNKRFSVVCLSADTTNGYDPTSCRFTIRSGSNNSEVTSTISELGNSRLGIIGLAPSNSKELANAFPWLKGNNQSYVLNLPNNIVFEMSGSTDGNLAISFSN